MRVNHPRPKSYAESFGRRKIKLIINDVEPPEVMLLTKKQTLRVIENVINARSKSEYSMNDVEYEWLYPLLKG